VAQGVGPEFTPQCWEEKKKEKKNPEQLFSPCLESHFKVKSPVKSKKLSKL
jgi:hypothetical protein